MTNHPRYAISLLPDELYSSTLTLIAMNMFHDYAQNYLVTHDHPPHLPIVEFHAPTDQAAHALFNRWATRDRSFTLEYAALDIWTEKLFEDASTLLTSRRAMVFFHAHNELRTIQEPLQKIAQQTPYTLIEPNDYDGLHTIELAELSRKKIVAHVGGNTAKLIRQPQVMSPALLRCDEHGHMVRVLAPSSTLAAH